ncbi:MAG TPA: hypothetical protein P5266_07805, partial [Candidatus Fermentibacter sp.]|nr:hypothetical protein [Candidatus Fermentibacter sp.]
MRLTPEVGVPRLERGGKYVFGWSVIRPAGAVPLPPEAVSEYGLPADGPLVVLSGSRSSRGMRVALPSRLEGTVFDPLLATPRGDGLLRLKNASMAEARIEGCVMSIP